MSATTRVLLAVLLAASLIGTAARHTPRLAAALALQGTVFVGTVTCTLDNSFVHRQPRGGPDRGEYAGRARPYHVRPGPGEADPRDRHVLVADTTKSTDPAQDVQMLG